MSQNNDFVLDAPETQQRSHDNCLQEKKGYIKPFGIENLGNTCYMNSALQCFLSLPHFIEKIDDYISDGKNPVLLTEIKNFIQDQEVHDPSKIKKILGKYDSTFADFSRQDSFAFLCSTISLLTDENQRVNDLFYGQLSSNIICKRCNLETSNSQPYDIIEISFNSGRRLEYIPYSLIQNTIAFSKLPNSSERIIIQGEYTNLMNVGKYVLMNKSSTKYEFIDQPSIQYPYIYAFEIPKNVKEGFGLAVVQLKTIDKEKNKYSVTSPFLCEVPLGQIYGSDLKKIITEKLKVLLSSKYDQSDQYNVLKVASSMKLSKKKYNFTFSEKPPFCSEYVTVILTLLDAFDFTKRQKKNSSEPIQLTQMFNGSIAVSQFAEGSKWKCRSCNAKCRSFQLMRFQTLPEILIFHIDRGINIGKKKEMNRSKVLLPQKISFAFDSNYKSFVPKDDDENALKYELRALSCHSGTPERGHYKTIGKRGDKWYIFNDSTVTQIPEPTEPTTEACSIIYEKINEAQ